MKRYKTTRQKERNKMPKFKVNDIINNAKTKQTVKVTGVREDDPIRMYQLKPLTGFNSDSLYREDYWWTEETVNECFELVKTELKFKVGDKLCNKYNPKDIITIETADPSNDYFTYSYGGDNYLWARESIEKYYVLYEPTYDELVKTVKQAKQDYKDYKEHYQQVQEKLIKKQESLDEAHRALMKFVEKDCE